MHTLLIFLNKCLKGEDYDSHSLQRHSRRSAWFSASNILVKTVMIIFEHKGSLSEGSRGKR